MLRPLLAFSMLLTSVLVGCGGDEHRVAYPITQLKARASSDFGCPAEEIKTNSLDARTKVARGCGQSGTYIYICNKCVDQAAALLAGLVVLDDCDCTWALDAVRVPRNGPADPPPASRSAPPTRYSAPSDKLEDGAFDRGSAAAALGSLNIKGCRMPDSPTGAGHFTVVFEPDGSVSDVMIDGGGFDGTSTGECIRKRASEIRVRPFDGASVKVGKSFLIE